MLKELAGEIRDGSHRLNRVVNNLLDMNRLESGVIRPKREWCDVRELLQSAVDIEHESINGRDIRLDVPEEIPLALVDHALIEQAVAKLLANAGSHTPPRPADRNRCRVHERKSADLCKRSWAWDSTGGN